MMKSIVSLVFLTSISLSSFGQTTQKSLTSALEHCQQIFLSGNEVEVKATFPLAEQKELLVDVIKQNISRKTGPFRIITFSKDSALVLLTGKFLFANSGEETFYSGMYSGIYVFKRNQGTWGITSKLPIDRVNQVTAHRIDASINPKERILSVHDTLTINTKEPYGFVLALNHKADISSLQLNGRKIEYVFDGGILWVKSRTGENQQLALSYSIQVENDEKDRNSGYFGDTLGHVRNQYFWHPFFNFSSANDRSDFHVRISIPKEYQLATSLPQKEMISGAKRIITGASTYPSFALGLYYDKEWELHQFRQGEYKLKIFSTKDFRPLPDTLFETFSNAIEVLSGKFGQPRGRYLSIVQDRSKGGNGWKNRSNDMIVAAEQGSYLMVEEPMPRAIFGHEVAHAWTSPAGPAANFLTEGWAQFAEGYLLEERYGEASRAKQMAGCRERYFENGYDGTVSLWEDYANGGVSYYKGSWLLYMLEEQLGKETFEKGLRVAMQSTEPMTIKLFAEKLSEASGKQVWTIMEPWLKSKQVPHLRYQVSNGEILLMQEGDLFQFPLDVQFTLKNGSKMLKTFNIKSRGESFTLGSVKPDEIISIALDPENKILLKTIKE